MVNTNAESQLKLGEPGYVPSQDEVIKTVEKGKKGLSDFKQSVYLITLHEMYKLEPYNCKFISDFILNEFQYSRASFYRIKHEVDINVILYGTYDAVNPKVNSFICQKLVKLKSILVCENDDERERGLRLFWEFLNKEQSEKITGSLVDSYIAIYVKEGELIPLELYIQGGGDIDHALKELTPNVISTFETNFIKDTPIDCDDSYDSPDSSCIQCDEEDSDWDKEDEGEWDGEGSVVLDDLNKNGNETQEKSVSYFPMMANIYSPKLIKVCKIVNEMNSYELLEIQNILDMMIGGKS